MCFKSSSSTKSHEITDSSSTPRYGQSDAFNNFMTGYNNQYTPENFAKVQDSATVNPYTTEAAARQQGIQPVLASTMDTTAQMSRDGLTEGDIQRYQNPYISNVINPQLDVFNKQNRAALNNIGSKMAAQGAYRNTGKNQAVFDYYGNVLPGQNLQTAQLYKDSYDNAQKTALANMQAKLQAGQTTAGLASTLTGTNQAQFNMGDALRNAEIQKSMIPYQLYNQGLAGQQTAGNMYGVDQHLVSDKNSTTTNSPSVFDSILKAGTAIAGAMSGMPVGLGSSGTSVQQGTQANGGWQTTTTPASSWWPFRDGGKVPAKAGGGGIGYAGGGSTSPDAFAQKVLEHAAAFSAFKGQQKEKARGGAIGKDVGGGIIPTEGWTDDRFGPDRFAPDVSPWNYSRAEGLPAPLGAMYGPRSDEMAEPLGSSLGRPPAEPPSTGTVDGTAGPELPTTPVRSYFAPSHDPVAPPSVPSAGAVPAPLAYPTVSQASRLSDPRGPVQGRLGGEGIPILAGGRGREPGTWGAYGEGLASFFGNMAYGKDPLASIAQRRNEDVKLLMEREQAAETADRLRTQLMQQGVHFQNADEIARATLAETQRSNTATIGSTQVNTDLNAEKLRRLQDPNLTFDEREALADRLGLQGRERAEYVATGDFPKATKTPETAFDTGLANEAVKEFGERSKAIAAGKGKLQRIEQMEALINDPRVAQGPAADYYLAAQKIAIAAGVPGLTEGVAAAETFRALANQFALELRNPSSGAGMPGAMSDADRNFLLQSTPGLTNTRQGNLLLAKLMRSQETYNVAAKQEEMRYIKDKQSVDGLSERMDAWARANPMIDKQTMAAVKAETTKAVAADPKATPQQKAAIDPNTPVLTVEDVKAGRFPPDVPFFKGDNGVVYKNPAYVDSRNAAAGIDRNPNSIYGGTP